jgi:hypothetical protein
VTTSALIVRRARFSIEEPWMPPANAASTALRDATTGSDPRLPTRVIPYYDESCLNVVFAARDDEIRSTHRQHDDPLYEEDVFEVFLAPMRLTEYFEIEVNPIGTTFDARVESPDGHRATMRVDLGWECRDLFAAVRVTREQDDLSVDTILRIPFASLGRAMPVPGEEWRSNFYRIDRHARQGDEFSAWQPTGKAPADFHVPAAFGRLLFE